MINNKTIILCGPTACGKTEIAQKAAIKFKGEIISADSIQIYKGLDIGTAKEKTIVSQHLIDICNPNENFSVYDYSLKANATIKEIFSRQILPIVCGGTGLYIDSLVYSMNFGGTRTENKEIEEEINLELEKFGNNYIYDKLLNIDPESAAKIHPNNSRRVARTLYLCLLNGKPLSKVNTKIVNPNIVLIVISRNRDELRHRIHERIDRMIASGLKNEVASLLEQGYNFQMQSLQGIGYKEWKDYFSGQISEEEVKKLILSNTNTYAKRQDTWFNNQYKDIAKYFNLSIKNSEDNLINYIKSIIVGGENA